MESNELWKVVLQIQITMSHNDVPDADHDDGQNITQELEGGSGEDDHNNTNETVTATITTTIANVLDSIGIEIYKFLYPKDLLFFSLASHHVFDEVSRGLIQTCLRQLPPNFGSHGIDHSISFNDRHSFPTKKKLLDHLLEKVKIAELKLVVGGNENQTMEDSLSKAREVFNDQVGAKFVSYDSELPDHLRASFCTAGYHYEQDNKGLATSRSKYILSRMSMERELMSKHTSTVKAWIDYILSQKHIVAGTWFWSCRHRNLDFRGVEGKGVMISSPDAVGEEMEICWTRLTASRI